MSKAPVSVKSPLHAARMDTNKQHSLAPADSGDNDIATCKDQSRSRTLSALHGAQKLAGASAEDEEEGFEAGEFEDLQAALQKVIRSKTDKAQQKQHAILQELQTSVDSQVAGLNERQPKTG